MRKAKVIVCSFTSTGHDTGKRRARPTYASIKAQVLEAGRYSVFEATDGIRDAKLFYRLHKDPELEVFPMAFPWTGVRLRGTDG